MANIKLKLILFSLIFFGLCYSQKPFRIGTTSASFLEMGFDTRGISMGNAQVAEENGLNSIYWNPAGAINLDNSEVILMIQPWILDIQQSTIGFSIPIKRNIKISVGYNGVQYGKEIVTTVFNQEGNGETFDGHDISLNITTSIKITDQFKFGISGKFIHSRIWNVNANAVCLDMGTIIKTDFLRIKNNPNTGLNLGMSISNYGTRMRYDGMGLKYTTDISEDDGNYEYTSVRFDTDYWELPLVFRLGISWSLIYSNHYQMVITSDAVHPNNNSEYLNFGLEYLIKSVNAEFAFRGGYNGVFMDESQYGLALGFGTKINFKRNRFTQIDFAMRKMEVFGWMKSFTIGVSL
jgi:hypothetical protein